jgi:hypothetical protein
LLLMGSWFKNASAWCPIVGIVWSNDSLILSFVDFSGLDRMRHRWAVGAGYPVCKKLARSRKGPVDQTLTAATTVRLGVISPPPHPIRC